MTPSLIHFAVVLSVSAVAVAPRLPIVVTAGLFALAALVGLGNAIWATVGIALRRPGPRLPLVGCLALWCRADGHLHGPRHRGGRLCERPGWAVYTNAALLRAPAHRRPQCLGPDHLDGSGAAGGAACLS